MKKIQKLQHFWGKWGRNNSVLVFFFFLLATNNKMQVSCQKKQNNKLNYKSLKIDKKSKLTMFQMGWEKGVYIIHIQHLTGRSNKNSNTYRIFYFYFRIFSFICLIFVKQAKHVSRLSKISTGWYQVVIIASSMAGYSTQQNEHSPTSFFFYC